MLYRVLNHTSPFYVCCEVHCRSTSSVSQKHLAAVCCCIFGAVAELQGIGCSARVAPVREERSDARAGCSSRRSSVKGSNPRLPLSFITQGFMVPLELAVVPASTIIYGCLAYNDIKLLASWLWDGFFRRKGEDDGANDPSKRRIDEALQTLTEDNFASASNLLQYAMLLAVILFASMGSPLFAVLCFLKSVVFMVIARGHFRMTAIWARRYLVLSYLLFIPFFWAPARKEVIMAYRIMMVIQCVDSQLHIPCQFLLSLAEAIFHVWAHGVDESAIPCVIIQVFAAATASTVSVVLENCLKQRLEAEFRSADDETITSGFRRVLRGICDGEILLNGDLKIDGNGHCLNRLMSTHEDFSNKRFQELLLSDEEEQTRFTKFISSSAKVCDDAPQCLRVSLCSSSVARVGVDVYHVALPHFRGCKANYHLLALKEDPETKAIPDALPQSFDRFQAERESRQRQLGALAASRARSAASAVSDGLCLFNLPQISEMILSLDSATQEIQQLHVNYTSDTLQTVGLRKLVRPTDWEKVRSSITKYVDHARRYTGCPSPKILHSLWVRRFDKPSKYMRAHKARLYFSATGRRNDSGAGSLDRVWLSLSSCLAWVSFAMLCQVCNILVRAWCR